MLDGVERIGDRVTGFKDRRKAIGGGSKGKGDCDCDDSAIIDGESSNNEPPVGDKEDEEDK